MMINKPTFKIKTVISVDLMVDGEDLEYTVSESMSSDVELTLESGEKVITIRRDDLCALSDRYPRVVGL